ncbi:zinc finger FYVE domain-containing protein 9 isoform X1 [Micropterus salmoides]|uniref:zinc finger FYVE domain-containing protein 9 isoform X1 n=1 Tax=Micropterus salmoides TaxID=27706 RepID=UPI0018EBF09E|nr:zinc finger FYVE domain-containing protein 9 isoform X1 [Micropterus salmoides]XP_038575123.1 zinc finger FYVE domain-containing protein 9 isoform X1 [Micropterus salmoides]
MENYFQAEAFNLDKVLDEFEQNEDETDSPILSDAKWTQILAPPAHLLSLNPALAHSDLSPRESPLPFKTLPDSSSSVSPGADPKRRTSPEPPSWVEERPADVHSPPLPQPNIGKLVGTDDLSPPPVTACSTVENGCPASPASPQVDGLSKEISAPPDNRPDASDQEARAASAAAAATAAGGGGGGGGDSTVSHTHFTFEVGLGQEETLSPEIHPNVEPTTQNGEDVKDKAVTAVLQGNGQEKQTANSKEEKIESVLNRGRDVQAGYEVEENGESTPDRVEVEEEKRYGPEGQIDQLLRITSLPNGLEQNSSSHPKLKEADERGEQEEEGFSPSPVPSKEDSVTEEKEMEESKQEGSEGGAVGSGSIQPKLNNNRLQPVSVPYGGARPKQPVSLKLQIPQQLSGQVLNQLGPSAVGKNKNHENQCRRGTSSETALSGTDQSAVGVNGDGVVHSPLLMPSESPDNDLQAGQQGTLCRKPASSLGEVAPVWVPDSQAPVCMKCDVKFTFTKRRHHCRACGKVFCATCCGLKCRLTYMDRKEARVCVICHSALMSAQSWETTATASNHSPNPNNPAEYCSTVPPLQQAQASGVLSSPPPTVMVPVGVLKQPGNEVSLSREQRRVWFADGVLPNGDAAESPKPPTSSPVPSQSLAVSSYSNKSSTSEFSEAVHTPVAPVGSSLSLIPEDGLPPILISTGVKGGTGGHITDYAVEERPSEIVLMQQLEEGGPDPLVFVLNANLLSMVKLVNYVNRKCWYVTTKGMHAVGQAEVVILLQCLPDEKTIPKDIFTHFVQLYQEALSGNVLSHLSHSFFTQSFLGSKEHGGFLYISPSFQSLQDLLLPNPPYLFGILIQKWETPWAKVFPIRLMLRLGAEYRFYPCPLFSVRFRKPLFGETGHTIMNLLADFRNYQYTLPVVKGLVVDMEVKKTSIKIPSNRYNELMKAMNKSNEHVLAMGACFNDRADSHLVCVQNDDGNYQTQAISIHHQPRKVTGACFFVFSGALKASSGFLAKTSIVEDGVMIQITAETMDSLRQALRDMKDFTITCGKADQEENQEVVHIQWTEDDHNFNKGVISPIDGKTMESVTSVKIFHGSEFKANGKVIRWTEVFFLQSEDQPNGLSDPADHSRLTENVARAFCMALCPHLKLLKEDGMAKLGLRVTLDSDQVGYLAGSNGQPLLPQYLSDLDSALIPVIHSGACQLSEGPVVMELVFYILEIIS